MEHTATNRTKEIHRQIITVCTYLRSKKHGVYNIFEDAKLYMSTETEVLNVDCSVVLRDGTHENVFRSIDCFASGYRGPSTYHPGRWEGYLRQLWEQALTVKEKADTDRDEATRKAQAELEKPASSRADAVFK
jgi:hypothetical protein